MKPTLEEVKAYFKNAKEVKSLFGTKFKIVNLNSICYSDDNAGIYYNDGQYQIWHPNIGYAEIISYKEPQFEYLEEVEVSDDNVVWHKRIFIGNSPCNKFYITWNTVNYYASYWKHIRKLNTERTQAIETIKELMTKHEIKTTEL